MTPQERLAADMLEARCGELIRERDEARANYQFMVDRAANEKLDGYRELGARAAAAENQADELRAEVERLKAAVLSWSQADKGYQCAACYVLTHSLAPEKPALWGYDTEEGEIRGER